MGNLFRHYDVRSQLRDTQVELSKKKLFLIF